MGRGLRVRGSWLRREWERSQQPPARLCGAEAGTHQKQADEGEQAVPQRPLVLALEHLGLEQLQHPQDVQEEGQVVLLPELLEVEVGSAVQESSNHGQMPGDRTRTPWA